ncbi:monofunctional biosynthetic peptidoglycan transglycosylase [Caulobacter sp. BP25]|uniref:monofunctional biosynthetic peptidoglycan transglycosylase n=1 Tax=Caulobacter sp. BP25 TaxID=2048900 RepID=UPI000C12CF7E|nr:monofunctional biosynthetic peptidoglycan transglycosylase [Caulobacter sp. BP25]PHY18935.1 monofunctional biosynthetic peptidoglycan transglycosylase [Caulobacter sp. BP25]
MSGSFWGRSLRRLLRNIALALFIILVAGPIVAVILFRFVPPPVTPLMVIRAVEGKGLDHRWRPIDEVAPALPRALIAAEDARFCQHHGFDFDALQKAYENNEAGKKVRGGSTISQQTAKNVFLWPGRSYVRKGLEAWFTVLIEIGWGKKRIMEVYLNSIEFGPGIYGAEAAAQRYFGVGADRLTQTQASRLAAILPSPLKWRVIKPGKYVAKRTQKIGKASKTVRRDGLADCVG